MKYPIHFSVRKLLKHLTPIPSTPPNNNNPLALNKPTTPPVPISAICSLRIHCMTHRYLKIKTFPADGRSLLTTNEAYHKCSLFFLDSK